MITQEKIMFACFYFNRILQERIGWFNKFRCRLWRIQLGDSSIFRGHCYFKKTPGSRIIIGDNFYCVSKVKESSLVKRPCTIQTNSSGATLQIGNNVGVSGCVIACFKNIQIGDNTMLGGNCTIFDGDFHSGDPRSGEPKDVIIGENVWIGYDCIILKGVHIGDNSVIGAGSVVTNDIPSNVVAAGNPCRVIKELKK